MRRCRSSETSNAACGALRSTAARGKATHKAALSPLGSDPKANLILSTPRSFRSVQIACQAEGPTVGSCQTPRTSNWPSGSAPSPQRTTRLQGDPCSGAVSVTSPKTVNKYWQQRGLGIRPPAVVCAVDMLHLARRVRHEPLNGLDGTLNESQRVPNVLLMVSSAKSYNAMLLGHVQGKIDSDLT